MEKPKQSDSLKEQKEWNINEFLSPADQKKLEELRKTIAFLSETIKNPWRFINDETVGETLRQLTELHKKAKEAQDKNKAT